MGAATQNIIEMGDLVDPHWNQRAQSKARAAWLAALEGAIRGNTIFGAPSRQEVQTARQGGPWDAYLDLRARVQRSLEAACRRDDMACYTSFADSLADRVELLLRRVNASAEQIHQARRAALILEPTTTPGVLARARRAVNDDSADTSRGVQGEDRSQEGRSVLQRAQNQMRSVVDVALGVVAGAVSDTADDTNQSVSDLANQAQSGAESRNGAATALDTLSGAGQDASQNGASAAASVTGSTATAPRNTPRGSRGGSKGGSQASSQASSQTSAVPAGQEQLRAQLLEQLRQAESQCNANQALSVTQWLTPLVGVWNAVTGASPGDTADFYCKRVEQLRAQIAQMDAAAAPAGASGAGASPLPPGGAGATSYPAPGLWERAMGFLGLGPSAPAQSTGKPQGLAAVVDGWFQDARQTALVIVLALVALGVATVYFGGQTAQVVLPSVAPIAGQVAVGVAPHLPAVVEAVASKPTTAVSGAVSDVARAFGGGR